jgi:Fungal Zn(2)-Cys(6) binuclear cluster domain
MALSLNVDPSLAFTPSASSLAYFATDDFALWDKWDRIYYPEVIFDSSDDERRRIPNMYDSPSPSPSPEPEPSPSEYSSRLSSSQPRSKKCKARHKNEQHNNDHHGKRQQTKIACSWCRKLSKKCDAERPCGRCKEFNRCDECVDAPPRKPRAKGVDRGTYQKTRDLAVVNYPEAFNRRVAYTAKKERNGVHVKVGLSPDQIHEATLKAEARNMKNIDGIKNMEDVVQETGMEGVVEEILRRFSANASQDGPMFSGRLEELFTCSDTPGAEEPVFIPQFASTLSSAEESSAAESSAEESLFEISSPQDSATDQDETDVGSNFWYSPCLSGLDEFPTIQKLLDAARGEPNKPVVTEEMRLWSESVLV